MTEERAGPEARPTVWVNCAVSVDGRLAYAGGVQARLSSPEDLVRVQRLRVESDAVLVGVGTIVADDPSLRVHWDLLDTPPGRAPMRVVVDGSGRTPPGARVLDGSIPTVVAVSERSRRAYPPHVRVVRAGRDSVDLALLLRELGKLGVRRLLVEGGARILAGFLRSDLVDRMTVYTAPVVIGGTTAPSLALGPESHGPDDTIPLRLTAVDRLGAGFVATYEPASR